MTNPGGSFEVMQVPSFRDGFGPFSLFRYRRRKTIPTIARVRRKTKIPNPMDAPINGGEFISPALSGLSVGKKYASHLREICKAGCFLYWWKISKKTSTKFQLNGDINLQLSTTKTFLVRFICLN